MRISKTFVTVDAVIFYKYDNLQLLLIKRKNEPFKDMWALPGGFLDENEDIEQAAYRELFEETGIKIDRLEQVAAFGKPGRDPRGHMISIAFVGIVHAETAAVGADDAIEARWFSYKELPPLAFDHHEIILAAYEKIKL